jgi:hypothetical protein
MNGKVLFDLIKVVENLRTERQASGRAIKATGYLIN